MDVLRNAAVLSQAAGNTAMSYDELRRDFVNQITSCSEMLVVLSPYRDPIVLKRAWCMFETSVANMRGVTTTMMAPPTDEAALLSSIVDPEEEVSVCYCIFNRLFSVNLCCESEYVELVMECEKIQFDE